MERVTLSYSFVSSFSSFPPPTHLPITPMSMANKVYWAVLMRCVSRWTNQFVQSIMLDGREAAAVRPNHCFRAISPHYSAPNRALLYISSESSLALRLYHQWLSRQPTTLLPVWLFNVGLRSSCTTASKIFCIVHQYMDFISTVHSSLPLSSVLGTKQRCGADGKQTWAPPHPFQIGLQILLPRLCPQFSHYQVGEGGDEGLCKETANSNSYFSSLVEKIFPVCGNKICASRVPKRQSRVLWILIEIEWQWNLHRKWRI